jgi:hypothetical protein
MEEGKRVLEEYDAFFCHHGDQLYLQMNFNLQMVILLLFNLVVAK